MILFEMGKGKEELRPFNADWWKPTQEEWAPILLDSNRSFWPGQTDPTELRPWQDQKDPKNTNPILRGLGRMFGSATISPEGRGFSAGPEVPGKYHQYGTSRMVARPWLGVPQETVEKLQEISWKHITK